MPATFVIFDPKQRQYLTVPPLMANDPPARWSPFRTRAYIVSAEGFDILSRDWPYISGCELHPTEPNR